MKSIANMLNPYCDVADAVQAAMHLRWRPSCRPVQGRVTLVIRGAGASAWQEPEQLEYARTVVNIARSALAASGKWQLSRRAGDALVVILEDERVVERCVVTSKWECVLPAARS